MPYAATVTKSWDGVVAGRRTLVLTISETGVTGSSDEKEITDLPIVGTVTDIECDLAAGAGSATSVDPRIGEAAGGAEVFDNGTPGDPVRDQTNRRYTSTGRNLYWSARANGTADTITTKLTIVEGHF